MTGRAPSGQALVSDHAADGVDGPSGFDPSRITERIAEIEPSILQPIIRKAADDFYCTVLDTAEDYLRENLDWNLKSHLSMLERENQRMRTELYEVDRKLGGDALGHERRVASIGELQSASNRYHSMIWAVCSKHDGEERHETALRYIREREAASGMSASGQDREAGLEAKPASPAPNGGDAQ